MPEVSALVERAIAFARASGASASGASASGASASGASASGASADEAVRQLASAATSDELGKARAELAERIYQRSDDYEATGALNLVNQALAAVGWQAPYSWKHRRKP